MRLSTVSFFSICMTGFLISVAFSIFSFGLTAPNLIFTSWPPYWEFQLFMWKILFNDRQLLGSVFLGLGIAYFTWFYVAIGFFSKHTTFTNLKNVVFIIVCVSLPLLLSNTALSYDVFNYAFNAKMVILYEQNPHIKIALDFPQDDWLRFMHNTHTPAPYGYGWTYLSLLPYLIAGGAFTKTWFLFRVFNLVVFSVLFLVISFFLTKQNKNNQSNSLIPLLLLFFHPLFLIEIISSSHNDLWMLTPAVISMILLLNLPKKINSKLLVMLIVSAGGLAFSIWVKLATVVLVPLWVGIVVLQLMGGFKDMIKHQAISELITRAQNYIFMHWAVFSSMLLFIPLMTERSKYFLPWYGIWSLVWLPLFPMRSSLARLWASFILAITTSVFFRYLPYLWSGSYEGNTTNWQLLITWVGALVLFPVGYYYLTRIFGQLVSKHQRTPKQNEN